MVVPPQTTIESCSITTQLCSFDDRALLTVSQTIYDTVNKLTQYLLNKLTRVMRRL